MPALTVSLAENGEASVELLGDDDCGNDIKEKPVERSQNDNENNEKDERMEQGLDGLVATKTNDDEDNDSDVKEPLVGSQGKDQRRERSDGYDLADVGDDENGMTEIPLTENLFSLIYTAPVCSSAFGFAMVITCFQIAMPLLALVDLIVFTDDGNPLQVPNNVSPQVRIMGTIALVLSGVQFWDFMEAVRKLQKGPPDNSSDLPSGVSRWKFYFAYFLQFLMGFLFLVTIFTLVLQSTEVVSMFLNFAALEFIVNVDDVFFILAQRGFITNSMKKACDEVCATTIIWRKGGGCMRRVLMFLTMGVLLGTYGYMRVEQLNGRFDCTSIDVQFGDGFITILPVFSGRYARRSDFYGGRPVYVDKRERAIFRYCRDQVDSEIMSVFAGGFWAFGVMEKYDEENIENVCNNFLSRSPSTEGYSILQHPGNSWMVKHRPADSMAYTVDYMSLRCADCSPSTCNGKCVEGECVCSPEQFGISCQFDSQPCDLAHYDLRTSQFAGAENNYSPRHELLRNSRSEPITLYDRPIYAQQNVANWADLLIYMGRRYALLFVDFFESPGSESFATNTTLTAFADTLEGFHPYYDWLEPEFLHDNYTESASSRFVLPEFISDPIDFGTASDINSPMGLSWVRATATTVKTNGRHAKDVIFDVFKLGANVDTALICGKCSEDNECFNRGFCAPDGSCSCTFENVGMLCEADCYEDRVNDYCPICFATPEDPTCGECYSRKRADDCPLCFADPLAEDCLESCLLNFSAPHCRGSWEVDF